MRCLTVGLTIEHVSSSAIPLVFVDWNVLDPVQVADLVFSSARIGKMLMVKPLGLV